MKFHHIIKISVLLVFMLGCRNNGQEVPEIVLEDVLPTEINTKETEPPELEILVTETDELKIPEIKEFLIFDSMEQNIVFESLRNDNLDIYIMNEDGSNERRLTYNDAHDSDPNWSPDGTAIVFKSDRTGNRELFILNETGIEQITNHLASDFSPKWSPDGKWIAFSSDRDGDSDIYIYNIENENLVQLTNNVVSDFSPDWSPDSQKIIYVSNVEEYVYKLYIVSLSDQVSELYPLEKGLSPSWSPNGKWILFTNGNAMNANIFKVSLDGEKVVQLTFEKNGYQNTDPSWSPDGEMIVFYSNRVSGKGIFIMNSDGSEVENISREINHDWFSDWGP